MTELAAVMVTREVREREKRMTARRVMSVSDDVAASSDLCQLRVAAVNIMYNYNSITSQHYRATLQLKYLDLVNSLKHFSSSK